MATTDYTTTNLGVNFYASETQFSAQGNHSSSELHLIPISYVVETYHNGMSWYRVWSDGCIEQGGTCVIPGSGGVVVTLHKPYSSTNYVVLMCNTSCDISLEAGITGREVSEQKTSTSFYADYYYAELVSTVMWTTIGY